MRDARSPGGEVGLVALGSERLEAEALMLEGGGLPESAGTKAADSVARP